MTYVVQHGPLERPFEEIAESVGAAARIAVGFVREKRPNVRMRLPGGDVIDFVAFQDAVFQGELKD